MPSFHYDQKDKIMLKTTRYIVASDGGKMTKGSDWRFDDGER